MAWLKAYEWEHATFPSEQKISILPEYRIPLTEEILKLFGARATVRLSTHGGGHASSWGIDIGKPGYDCHLGVIYHEVAHVLNRSVEGERGHTGTFKKWLIKVYVETKVELPKIWERVRSRVEANKVNQVKQVEKVTNQAQKKADRRAYQKTRAYRIEKTVKRIAKLERKAKSIATRLKSAKRSLGALQRAEVKANQVQAKVPNEVS